MIQPASLLHSLGANIRTHRTTSVRQPCPRHATVTEIWTFGPSEPERQIIEWKGIVQVCTRRFCASGGNMTSLISPSAEKSAPDKKPLSERNQQKAHAMGLTSATALVIGSIVGTGVFTMPAVLAGAGTMGIAVLAVIAVGAMLLAVLFGQLTRRVPKSDGGLYAYARHEFGDFAGYLVGWCYWIQAWAGNAAIVASWVFYVDALFGIDHPTGMENWGIALLGLWIPAAINLAGSTASRSLPSPVKSLAGAGAAHDVRRVLSNAIRPDRRLLLLAN